jgi:translation initiation factor 2 beta subunit (eIF-2beta)/eIF-5
MSTQTTTTKAPAARIQEIKSAIIHSTSRQDQGARDILEIIYAVEMDVKGFASDVAKTVAKYGRASEKQAYVIARAFVESGLQCSHGMYAGI